MSKHDGKAPDFHERGGAVSLFKRQVFDLTLDKTKASDDDLKVLDVFPELEGICLASTLVTDASQAHVTGRTKLTRLGLR